MTLGAAFSGETQTTQSLTILERRPFLKDEKAGVAYVGGEPEHQRYQQLVAQASEEEMKHPFAQTCSNQLGPAREP
jgi:hypothetical protein